MACFDEQDMLGILLTICGLVVPGLHLWFPIPLLPLEEYVVEIDNNIMDRERSMARIERPGATNESHIPLLRDGDT